MSSLPASAPYSSPSPVTIALSIPHILSSILWYVLNPPDDLPHDTIINIPHHQDRSFGWVTTGAMVRTPRGSLRAAVQVNQLWAHEATRILWDHLDHDRWVRWCELSSDRRRWYARKVAHLTIGSGPFSPSIIEDLRLELFPRLKRLVFDKWGIEDWRCCQGLLGPHLEDVSLYGNVVAKADELEEVLGCIKAKIPRLDAISLVHGFDESDLPVHDICTPILKFLESMPLLADIRLSLLDSSRGWYPLHTYLTRRANLRCLDLDCSSQLTPAASWIPIHYPPTTPIFPVLESLETYLEASNALLILPSLTHLTSLDLDLWAVYLQHPASAYISNLLTSLHCPNLNSLTLSIDHDSNPPNPIPGYVLASLTASCPRISWLDLRSPNRYRRRPNSMAFDASDISDTDVDKFAKNAKRLVRCSIDFDPKTTNRQGLTWRGLKSLGTWCTELEVLHWPVAWDLMGLANVEGCLFPCVEYLGTSIGGMRKPNIPEPGETSDLEHQEVDTDTCMDPAPDPAALHAILSRHFPNLTHLERFGHLDHGTDHGFRRSFFPPFTLDVMEEFLYPRTWIRQPPTLGDVVSTAGNSEGDWAAEEIRILPAGGGKYIKEIGDPGVYRSKRHGLDDREVRLR